MNYAVIMAGGKGERFWPMSRLKTPKQLLAITGEKTMIQKTVDRLRGFVQPDKVVIITNSVQSPAIKKQLPDIPTIIAEPCGRNTAPCIMLAAAYIAHEDENAIMVVLPADHVIHQVNTFSQTLADVVALAEREDALFTIGITPTYPATGYGYIHAGTKIDHKSGTDFFRVEEFREKPNLEVAKQFIESGEFFWNSGIFVWRVKTFLQALQEFMPDLYKAYTEIREAIKKGTADTVIAELYPGLANISVDYGIMEKAKRVMVAKSRFDWDDVGAWDAVASHFPRDEHGNVVRAKFIGVDTSDCIVFSKESLVGCVGVDNLIVVVTDDAVLVCDKSRAQDVKSIVKQLTDLPDGKNYL